MTHDQWWIKGGGSIGSCGYLDSQKSWKAALKNRSRRISEKAKAKIAIDFANDYCKIHKHDNIFCASIEMFINWLKRL